MARPRARESEARTRTTDGRPPHERGSEAVDDLGAMMRASVTVDEAFSEDDEVRERISENLKPRVKLAKPIADKVDKVFKGFTPSQFTGRQDDGGAYLAPGENLTTTMKRLALEGFASIRKSDNPRSLRFHRTDEVTDLLTGNNIGGNTMPLGDALAWLHRKIPPVISLREEPAFTICAAEKEAKKRIDAIEGKKPPAPPETVVPASTNGQPATANKLINESVHALMDTMPTPEEEPVLKRADLDVVSEGLKSFRLGTGPSDVASYHDFNLLQIAFEHVWAEVFDTRVEQLGRELYHTYIELLDITEYEDDPIKSVTSIEDIRTLMTHARELGRVTDNAMPATKLSQKLTDVLHSMSGALIELLSQYTVAPEAVRDIIRNFMRALEAELKAAASDARDLSDVVPARLAALLKSLDDVLQQPYVFRVFKKDAMNFGIMVTYRQTWVPEQYQVGDLVSTIPLAPRETRRYTTKQVTKKSRATKELEDNLRATKTGFDDTARAEREILSRAENKTEFKQTANGSYGTGAYNINATAGTAEGDEKISAATKKDFREAVLRSAQEYKQNNRMEVETSASEETEGTTYHEIQNPNDELTVTYLLYELQRTYRISERIQQLSPVVLVANEVPEPDAIDDAWLIEHDWILRRVILDDSFRPALDYLTKSFTGSELNLQILDNNAQAQRQVVDQIKAQVATQLSLVDAAQRQVSDSVQAQAGMQITEGFLKTVKNVFDPFKITGSDVTGTSEGMKTVAEYAQETLARAEREKMRLLDQLTLATTALQAAVDKLSAAIKEHYDRVTEIDRLRVHIKENILYYMQAIWDHEPPDQRYFRVFHLQVPIVTPKSTSTNVKFTKTSGQVWDELRDVETLEAELPSPDVEIEWKSLVEVADLDEVLGYKGNYAIYRLRENNYLTLHMMQNYLELSDEVKLRDPDELANFTVDELQELASCLCDRAKDVYTEHKDEIKKMIIDRLTSGRPEDDRVVVPTGSLYMEALPGTHTLLENFKLQHRILDVKKVQGEVRHAELENVRLAARTLKGKYEDPDIEKKIVIEGDVASVIPGE